MEKRRNCCLGAITLFSAVFRYLLLDFQVKTDQIFTSRYAVIRYKQDRNNESRLYMKDEGDTLGSKSG